MTYARVALPLPLPQLFDYKVPEDNLASLQVGMRVKVPFGRRNMQGFCVEISPHTEVASSRIRKITAISDEFPVVNREMLEFAKWMARYYHCSLGEVLESIVPSSIQHGSYKKTISLLKLSTPENIEQEIANLKEKSPLQARVLRLVRECDGQITSREIQNKIGSSPSPIKTLLKKGVSEELSKKIAPDPYRNLALPPHTPVELTAQQRAIFQEITEFIQQQQFQPFLLHGITGSGKTEIYIRCIQEVVAQGKQAIVLVPEIALTPQTVARFRQRFDHVAILHSELTPMQRAYQWNQIQQGQIEVIIGPRSALFAPAAQVGLIVVDEEHEPSFKQQNTPRYHARDMAVKRAQLACCPIILGSATPSLESYYNAQQKKYRLCQLSQRVAGATLPTITVINMKEECQEQKRFVYFSRTLLWALEKVLKKGEQAILFLNRRGFATSITCPQCGYHAICEDCSIPLTYHRKTGMALCHYCNREYRAPEICPVCQDAGIRYAGAGTQRIEKMLQKRFPEANIARMDSDTMIGRHHYEEILAAFEQKKIDFLLGTQMIAKGLDFPSVTVVGVVSADNSLQIPDFRAAERTFQLVVQVAGRSGRGEKSGRVIVQTYHPEHYAIQLALKQDYSSFVHKELHARAEMEYPPFCKLLRILFEGEEEPVVEKESQRIAQCLQPAVTATDSQMLGPGPAPLEMAKKRYRYHLIIKCKSVGARERCLQQVGTEVQKQSKVRISLDIDPVSMM